jgi:hypothetical protein
VEIHVVALVLDVDQTPQQVVAAQLLALVDLDEQPLYVSAEPMP